jgi:flagellar assembly factor FliW
MLVKTARFGEVEVSEEGIFHFPMGLLGFSKLKDYFILDHRDDSPFKWMQSAEDGDLAFIVTDPLFFKRDYHINCREAELSTIGPVKEEDLVVSVIMTIPEDPQQMSANLLAPLIFNMGNRRAMQYVLTDHRYPVKYFVMQSWQDPATPLPPGAPEPRSISLR